MFENRWNDKDAEEYLKNAGPDKADQEVALRVYTSRLIGQNPDLVMHGGGNTSVKVMRKDLFGQDVRVLHVKGSGWDLGTIEARGLPALHLDPLLDLRKLAALSDEDMVNQQRKNLIDSTSPNPSVETLLHAYLPYKYVDHTHATPFLAFASLPDLEKAVREVFGDKLAIVPYILPGFGLAKAAADVFDANPDVEGLLLSNHGHFAFGETARASYDKIIEHTNMVEDWLVTSQRTRVPVETPPWTKEHGGILAELRGAVGEVIANHTQNADAAMPVLDVRNNPDVMSFLTSNDLKTQACHGVATPDHVLRTKRFPLVLDADTLSGGAAAISKAVANYVSEYKTYFERNANRTAGAKKMLSPHPCVAWVAGLGIVGIGADAKAASAAADLAEQTLRVIEMGTSAGGFFPINEADTFDCEYWSLEQAKLGKGIPPAFSGKIVLVTGGAGAIGLATAKAFAARGAQIFLVDKDDAALSTALDQLGNWHQGIAVDITATEGAQHAVDACVRAFGGVDILVSNAGAATSGDITIMPDEMLRSSFELNFFAHQAFAKAVTSVLRAQGRQGQLLFNVSKQAVNPGKGFGAYGLPKATTMFLVRQLALELGSDGIRVNGVNADRIRSGLLDEKFIETRATARGVDVATYMAGNILGREVEAHHVADAFVHLALSERTTAHLVTVDGGNIEAALR